MSKQVTLTSAEVYTYIKGGNNFKTAAMHFMPKGVKWFESGEDWSFALWLERLCRTAVKRGNHVRGTYTFNDKKCKC